jgi:potassium-dependent mechanosensitive channel
VIRTADGAEVIVPNGSLISSQVTNWTFSDRERAVEVSVSVVGGVDPQRVIESLKSTAAAQPGVAKDPSPQVYVVNFTAAAVTFQLRAWTDRYQDWAQLRSDLSVAVNETLAREKITIACWKFVSEGSSLCSAWRAGAGKGRSLRLRSERERL